MNPHTDHLPVPNGMTNSRWVNTLRGNRRFRKALRENREPTAYQIRCNSTVEQQRELLNSTKTGLDT